MHFLFFFFINSPCCDQACVNRNTWALALTSWGLSMSYSLQPFKFSITHPLEEADINVLFRKEFFFFLFFSLASNHFHHRTQQHTTAEENISAYRFNRTRCHLSVWMYLQSSHRLERQAPPPPKSEIFNIHFAHTVRLCCFFQCVRRVDALQSQSDCSNAGKHQGC